MAMFTMSFINSSMNPAYNTPKTIAHAKKITRLKYVFFSQQFGITDRSLTVAVLLAAANARRDQSRDR